MLQINNETAHAMFYKLIERFDKIEKMLELLGVTHRTLARYRQKKLIRYYMIDGRTYYKASEVKDFFEQKGLPLPASMRNNPNV